MKQILLSFLFIILTSLSFYSQIKKANIPNWVAYQSYNENPNIEQDEISQGTLTLLYSEQVNIKTQEAYYRNVTKITDNVGVQEASSINALYDPSYQKIYFHKIFIKRGNQIIDKLDINNFQSIRMEANAENYVYNGALNAILNLSDVRTGDIVDVSFTVKGFNPIHKGNFSTFFYLDSSEPVGKIFNRILASEKLYIKNYNTDSKPELKTKNKLNTYSWLAENTKSVDYEDNTPYWEIVNKTIQVTNTNTWKSVGEWANTVYKVDEKPNQALNKKIQEIKNEYQTEHKRIKASLDFVQNEIRYLALSSGIGAYKPFTPNKIFNNRYGDCKDKSILMVNMLNAMDIEAYPMLVSSSLKYTLPKLLPSHRLFDHCVVKVFDKAGNEFWYDPTIPNQGGDYKTTYFPDYRYGLVIKAGVNTLDEIVSTFSNDVETMDEYELENVGKGASLKVTTVYYENEADKMRNYYRQNSISNIEKENLNYYQNFYNHIKSLKNPEYVDNMIENKFTVVENYQIDSLWIPDTSNPSQIQAVFTPYTLFDILSFPNTTKKRKQDYILYYPASRRQRIKIKLPKKWNIKNEDMLINSKAFYFDWSSYYDRKNNLLTLDNYLQIQKDFVPISEFDEFNKKISKFEQNSTYRIFYSKNNLFSDSSVTDMKYYFKLFMIVLAVLAGLFILFIIKVINR